MMEESKRRRPTDLGPSGERVGKNVADLRQVTTGALADQLAALGHPLQASAITKIEKGTRRVDVDDLVALAVALGVTPNRLLLPGSDGGSDVELTPEVTASFLAAWQWACGEARLPDGTAFDLQQALEFHRRGRPHDPGTLTPEQTFDLVPALVPLFEQIGAVVDEKGVSIQTAVSLLRAWGEIGAKPNEKQPTPADLGLPQRPTPDNSHG